MSRINISIERPDDCAWSDEDFAGAVMNGFNYKGERIKFSVVKPADPIAWIYRKYDADIDDVSFHVLWPGMTQTDDNDPLPVYTSPPPPTKEPQ